MAPYRLPILFTPLACSAYSVFVIVDPRIAVPGGIVKLNFTLAPQDPQSFDNTLHNVRFAQTFDLGHVGPPVVTGEFHVVQIPISAPPG
jgi:hypothetical protein